MGMNIATLLPALMRLREFLEVGVEHATMLRGQQGGVDVGVVAAFLFVKMESWNPSMAGVSVVDDETKQACARFLAGIATNIAASANAATRPRRSM